MSPEVVAKVCAAAGITPIRLHDLRHSMATFALRQGVDLKTIQTMLRHSRLATTADLYTHVLQEVQRSGADRMGDLLHEFGVGRGAANEAGAATSAANQRIGARTPPG